MKIFTVLLFTSCFFYVIKSESSAEENNKNIIGLNAVKVKNANIQTEEPQFTTFETTQFAIGRIQAIPSNRTTISSRIAGRVVNTPPIVGDFVEEGQTVFRVESRQPGSPPPIIPVKALKSGIVFGNHTSLGKPVEPSDELMDIIDISQVWAVADIPESKATAIKIGQTAHIRVISLGDQQFTGEIISFGTEADIKSGTIKAIFLLENPDLTLKPNMLTEFNITTQLREKILSVPNSAIQGDHLNAHIFKREFKMDHSFRKVPVVTGESNFERTEIVVQNAELTVVDEVVISGGYFLSHSSKSDQVDLLKALDEAHGHKHNPDGSEMSAEQAAAEKSTAGVPPHGSSSGSVVSSKLVKILIVSNCIFIVMLIFTIIRKKDVS